MTQTIQVQDLAAEARAIADKLGIQKFDIFGSVVDETSVEVDRGEPKQVEASNRSGVTVRVWNDQGTVGVTSTTDVHSRGLELALKTAYEASFFGAKDNVPDFSPESTAPLATTQGDSADSNGNPSQAPVPVLLEHLAGAEKALLEAHPAIQGVPYNGMTQRVSDRFYLNSAGAARNETRATTTLYLYTKPEQEGKRPRSAGAYRVSPSLDQLDVAGCWQEAAAKTISHLDYEKISSGKYRVVFSPEAFLSLLRAFSNLFNAQSILDNQSLSTPDSLGTPIASPLLSVLDDPLHPAHVGMSTFDGEGTPTRQVALIKDGVLTSFIHSAGTAKRMNAQPTGHANMGAKITVSPHYFHVCGSATADPAYDLDNASNLVLIDDVHALHAGVQALQGSFSLPFDGWLINEGQRTSIESATVAGDFREVLKAIVYVEPEEKVTPGGICPRIWVDELSITGE